MRVNLREARTKLGYTQERMSEAVGISHIYYQKIEEGTRTGNFEIWDKLEDITGIHQRILRANAYNRPAQADSP